MLVVEMEKVQTKLLNIDRILHWTLERDPFQNTYFKVNYRFSVLHLTSHTLIYRH